MSVFEKLQAARRAKDIKGYVDMMTDDCVFVRHQTGSSMNKAEIADLLQRLMDGGGTFDDERCVYENDDILVVHSRNSYPDGTREAVMAVYSLRDGKISKLETGATPLPS